MGHVPPRRFFPSATRASLHQPLLTLNAHPECHKPWGKDEEYFFNSLLPGALDGPLGADLAKDFRASLKHDGSRRLAEAVLRQFDERPSGLVLPPGRLVQRLDGTRLARVVWKIVRGLYFVERGRVLPEDTPRRLCAREQPLPPFAETAASVAGDGRGWESLPRHCRGELCVCEGSIAGPSPVARFSCFLRVSR